MRFGERMVCAAYVALFGLLIFAVADYGLTRNATLPRFQIAMGGVLGFWLLGCIMARRWPKTGVLPWIPVLILLGLGWAKTGVGVFFERENLTATDIAISVILEPDSWLAALSRWGSVSGASSLLNVGTATVLLGGMLMAIEIWRNEIWARFLLLTMVFIGFGITVLFLLQVTVGEPFQPLNLAGRPTRFFVYNYHGSGAAFLNLFWPVALAVAMYCGLRRGRFWVLWIVVPVPMFAALFMNVSKAGNVLAVVGLGIFALLAIKGIRSLLRKSEFRVSPAMFAAVLLPLLVIGASCYYAIPWERWDSLLKTTASVEDDTRIRAYSHFLKMIPDAGWTGFGPGTFEKTYRPYLKVDPQLLKVPFWLAHQDYIQTVVEWGYLGAALWGWILLVGAWGLTCGIFANTDPPALPRQNFRWGPFDPIRRWFLALPESNQPLLLAGVGTAVMLTAIHAAFDFPMQIPSLGLYFLIWTSLGWSLLVPRKPDWADEDD